MAEARGQAGMRRRIGRVLQAVIVAGLLAVSAIARAQDESAEAASDLDPGGPGGITTLIFLLGVAGILVVGGIHVARDSFRPDDDA